MSKFGSKTKATRKLRNTFCAFLLSFLPQTVFPRVAEQKIYTNPYTNPYFAPPSASLPCHPTYLNPMLMHHTPYFPYPWLNLLPCKPEKPYQQRLLQHKIQTNMHTYWLANPYSYFYHYNIPPIIIVPRTWLPNPTSGKIQILQDVFGGTYVKYTSPFGYYTWQRYFPPPAIRINVKQKNREQQCFLQEEDADLFMHKWLKNRNIKHEMNKKVAVGMNKEIFEADVVAYPSSNKKIIIFYWSNKDEAKRPGGFYRLSAEKFFTEQNTAWYIIPGCTKTRLEEILKKIFQLNQER